MKERPFSDISFELYLNEEKLMGSKCMRCDALFVPPKPICTQCYSTDMKWVEMQGRGKLSAFTCIAICPPAMIEEGYGRNNPYCSGVVKLDEGVRVDARIDDVDPKDPESIKVGMPMKVKFIHRKGKEGQKTTLAFRPA